MAEKRRRFSPEQKAAILREHLIDRILVSDLCEKHGIQPPMFYRWQKQMFDQLPGLFAGGGKKSVGAAEARNRRLAEKLAQKDEIIAEIMAEFIAAKKKSGEL